MGNFLSTGGVELISRKLELMEEEESSHSHALCHSKSGSQSLNSSQFCYKLKGKRCIDASSKDSVYIQLINIPVEFNKIQVKHFIPTCIHLFAPTLESTSSLISIVTSRLGLTGTRARWLFRKSCLWDNIKVQASGRVSWELINSWTRSFTARVTESGPRLIDISIPSLGTEKIILLHR